MRPREGVSVANLPAACCTLGINLQPAHPDTPTDKPKIERTLQSVATLFAQHVAGYVGSSVERRGKNAEQDAVWSIVELQALLDEWIVAVWQNRPHDGLRDPVTPGKALTPNEKYAALVEVAGMFRCRCRPRTTSSYCRRAGGASMPTGSGQQPQLRR